MKYYNATKRLRELKKMDQQKLATLADVKLDTIKSIEEGKYIPSVHLGIKIADILGYDIHDVFPLNSN